MSRALVKKAVGGFEGRFGRRPRWAAAAPGRVNLIGEHTDYNDGYALPMAIDRQVVIAADVAADSETTLCAIDLDEETTTGLTGKLRPQPGSFANYLLGVADQFRARDDLPNLDLVVTGSVPIGSGLASSAAVEVAMATLLQQVTGSKLDALELALLCQRAEHEFAGTPCGIMDMFIATHAREGQALLIDCRSMQARPIPVGHVSILIVDTTVRRELVDSAYADRRRPCRSADRCGAR
jgi:galactokinase